MLYTFLNNIAYTAFITGNWDESLAVTEEGLAGDVQGTHRIWLLGNEVTVRASRGEDVSAALEAMRSEPKDGDDADQMIGILDSEANAYLARGMFREAGEASRKIAAIQAAQGPGSLYQAARSALWARDVEQARADLAGIDATGVQGPIIETRRRTIAAGIAALEGRTADAQALYRDAFRGWKESGMGWEEALTGLDTVFLLGADADPAVVEATRSSLERLGAKPYIAMLDAALASSGHAARPVPSRRTESISVESV